MTALTFTLADLATGRGLAHAIICFEARYASVAWLGETRLDRKFVERADWRMLELALVVGLPNTSVESTHIVQRILVPADRRSSVLVQWAAKMPLDVAPARVAEILDAWLRDLAAKCDGQVDPA